MNDNLLDYNILVHSLLGVESCQQFYGSLVPTLSLANPKNESSWGCSADSSISNCLKVFQNKMLVMLPWFISVSLVMTMGSSCSGPIPLKSALVNVMPGISNLFHMATMFTIKHCINVSSLLRRSIPCLQN